jgi:hypothetical protein
MGRMLPFGPGNAGMFSSTCIRPITGRHSLLAASHSRTANSVPYGFYCPSVPGQRYGGLHVPPVKCAGFGACRRPEGMWVTKTQLISALPVFFTVLLNMWLATYLQLPIVGGKDDEFCVLFDF